MLRSSWWPVGTVRQPMTLANFWHYCRENEIEAIFGLTIVIVTLIFVSDWFR